MWFKRLLGLCVEADLKVDASKQTSVSILCDPVFSHVKVICNNPEDMIEVEIPY